MEIDLNKIKVEPVYDYFERADVDTVLSREHPLGVKKAIGNRISYAASYRGEWLAVLVFDKAIDRNKHREREIGWSKEQVVERRKHIANNSRFAIISKFKGVKNLASKILSLVSQRISDDWQKHYGIPILALETYVDPDYHENEGSCYKAAGWKNLGLSSGHLKCNGERTHGKWYFLKPLHKDSYKALLSELPHALITGVKPTSGESNNNFVLDASKIDLGDLQKELEQIKDPRGKQGQIYRFVPLLSLCISAVLSGYTQYRQIADWIEKLPASARVKFGLPGDRVPDETTISKFVRKIDPTELNKVLTQWLLKTYDTNKIEIVSLDGKTQRATSSLAKEQKCFLNVYAHDLGIVINHLPTKKGAGEKVKGKKVLKDDKVLEEKVILSDAIHTDKTFVKLVEKKTLRMSSLSKVIRNL